MLRLNILTCYFKIKWFLFLSFILSIDLGYCQTTEGLLKPSYVALEVLQKYFAFTIDDPPALTFSSKKKLFTLISVPFPVLYNSTELSDDSEKTINVSNPSKAELANKAQSKIIIEKLEDKSMINLSDETLLTTYFNVISANDFNLLLDELVGKKRLSCCTPSAISDKLCFKEGSIISPLGATTMRKVSMKDLMLQSYSYTIPTTDVYLSFLSSCESTGSFNMQNKVKHYLYNYYGYLPGTEAPKLTLYMYLCTVYAVLSIVWLSLVVYYQTQMLHIHCAIVVVLALNLVESFIWLLLYSDWNASIDQNMLFLSLAIFSSALKNTVSLILLWLASLGWGVTMLHIRPEIQKKIIWIGSLLFISETIKNMIFQFLTTNPFLNMVFFFLIIFISLLYATIFLWIFQALSIGISELQSQNQLYKLKLFTNFWFIILFAIGLTIVLTIIQTILLTYSASSSWRHSWIATNAIPSILYVVVFVAMLLLWAPSRHSRILVYSSELPDSEQDEDYKLNASLYGLPKDKYKDYVRKLSNATATTDLEANAQTADVATHSQQTIEKPSPDNPVIIEMKQ